MSELAMTAVIGPSHRNSGLVGYADVFAALYVGGSGAWIFTPVSDREGLEVIRLSSQRDLAAEIRAGASLSLGLGEARAILEQDPKAALAWRNRNTIDLSAETLRLVADQSRDMGVAMQVASDDVGLVEEFLPSVQDEGWSITLCGPVAQNLSTQWG